MANIIKANIIFYQFCCVEAFYASKSFLEYTLVLMPTLN